MSAIGLARDGLSLTDGIADGLIRNAASATLLIENFDAVAEAPGGHDRLRVLILSLAARGKLVEHQAGDEPASRLLDRLRAESAPSKEGAPLIGPALDPEDCPYELPSGWSWARFSEVASIESNLVPPLQFRSLPHIAPDNIEKGTGRLLPYRTIGEDGVTSGKHRFYAGQILYSKIRPNLSKVVLVDFDGLCSADMYPLAAKIDRRYLLYFLLSDVFLRQVVKADNRLAMPKVNQQQLSATLVAVPPLAEQRRVVVTVDRLMSLCDELDTRLAKKTEMSFQLTKSALGALANAGARPDLDVAWQRVDAALPAIVNGVEPVKVLKAAILDLAIRGRLVKSEDTDRPLVEEIHRERERLCRALGIRPPPPQLPVEEIPFPIPRSWSWVRLGDLCVKVADGPHFSPKYVDKGEGVPFLSTRNIKAGGFDLEDLKYVSHSDHAAFCKRTRPQPGDVLYTKGGTTGIAVVNTLPFEFSVWVHLAVLKLIPTAVDPEYLALALNSPHCYSQSQELTHGTGNRDLGLTRMVSITLPLPPLAEQLRITAAVRGLHERCEELAERLELLNKLASQFATAVAATTVASTEGTGRSD